MLPNVALIGSGEYTTGYTGQVNQSDKSRGVAALVFLDLHDRGKVGDISIAGTNGSKFPAIRAHMKTALGDYYGLDTSLIQTFPADHVPRDEKAYLQALDQLKQGDMVCIFTPDNTHFEITMAAIQRGLHVILTKPPVKTLEEHTQIVEAARKNNVLVYIEVHKRFDPIYSDARERIRNMGDFGYFSAYMSQPKYQLETFKSWAGKLSDISYYLNSHHIDFHVWTMQGRALPIRVYATAATGVCKNMIEVDAEDTITLMVEWVNLKSGAKGTANYTSSWSAPKADVHSQQRFFYMGHGGEISADQAHRGYTVATDADGFKSVNPLYFRYVPNGQGKFAGQNGYGYKSFEAFVDAVIAIRSGKATVESFDNNLPTAHATLLMTAILEAGRMSLDKKGMPIDINYHEHSSVPSSLEPAFK